MNKTQKSVNRIYGGHLDHKVPCQSPHSCVWSLQASADRGWLPQCGVEMLICGTYWGRDRAAASYVHSLGQYLCSCGAQVCDPLVAATQVVKDRIVRAFLIEEQKIIKKVRWAGSVRCRHVHIDGDACSQLARWEMH